MKSPEDIKKGLWYCTNTNVASCSGCVYWDGLEISCNVESDALAYIKQLESQVPVWISVNDGRPMMFASVLGYMTDAGNFPAVRECFRVTDEDYYFPALRAIHPISHWMHMPTMGENNRTDKW